MFIENHIMKELTMLGNSEVYHGILVLPGLIDELGK